MKFCSMLVSDINFEPDALQPCCNTGALGKLPRFPFSGGAIAMPDYERHIAASLEAMQEPGGMCSGCDKLVDLDVPEGKPLLLKPRFQTVSINMHRHLCNCRCVYCGLWQKPSKSYEALPAIKSLARQHVLSKDCLFSWGGGEPTILGEFEQTSQWIFDNGHFQYVHSNALRFSPVLAELLARGKAGLNVSLDSGSSAVYRDVKGVDGFDRVTTNLRKYAESAADMDRIELKYIVFEKNNSREEVDRFLALCGLLGVRRVQLSLNFLEVNANRVSDLTLNTAAYFLYRAMLLNLQCAPFFLSGALVTKIMEMTEAMAKD